MAAKEDTAHYIKSSVGLLAQQSSTPNLIDDKKKDRRDWDLLRSHLETRIAGLRSWRQSWWSLVWADCAEFILPRRSTLMTQGSGGFPVPNNTMRGAQLNNSIINPHGTYAARVCASGLMTGLASPSREWFKMKPTTDALAMDAAARAWFDETEKRIYAVLGASNFYESFAQECEDNTVFGTAPTIIYEDEADVIRLYNPIIGEYFLSASATMRIDGLYRTFVMTAQQAVDFFGVDKTPAEIKSLWEQKGSGLDKERIVAHAIEPNFGIGKDGVGKVEGDFAWREVYWVYANGAPYPLSVRGFKECPFTVSRWSVASNDAYGRSPGMDVVNDVKQLQVQAAKKAEAIAKQVDPPLLGDASMKNQPSSSIPGDITYVASLSPSTGLRPIYTVNPDLNAMVADIAITEARISRGFFNDVFMTVTGLQGDRRTAAEIAQRVSEAMAVLGPVVENVVAYSLEPKLKRIYAIMQRRGFIPPLPDSLKGVPIKMEFDSMVKNAQRGSQLSGIERMLALLGNTVSVFPEARDNLDIDTLIQVANDMLGNPASLMRDKKQVAAIRQQQSEQQAKMQKMSQIQQMAEVAQVGSKAGKNLSETETGAGQNALANMFG